MSWKCDIVMDLAPLYCDGMANEGSRRLVKKHLRECAECRAYYRLYRPVLRRMGREAAQLQQGQDYACLAKRMRIRRALAFIGVVSYVGATLCVFTLHRLHKKK